MTTGCAFSRVEDMRLESGLSFLDSGIHARPCEVASFIGRHVGAAGQQEED